ncbi:hypothetical protein Pst134EA_025635 [Puccinia striiformis f. sp. tritici]|uniref:RING-type domain-containing protein n=2 Tax=Puccinia striiformis f. sp. tritici PST-78 TaxID=1165861 RepID=A0A0L0V4A4_9BASI|nr:hypothetical protein Pst134EA_025635 [Puccinia striiformis f. sp. tritici]KAH9443864.1 hypothetical protein Pst134EB_026255 [Puccinia striiformis f. sp. tritici]KAH9451691.1 hypothetical protein Pst134EA_025635 [Puccinia striiformis f. sp. tritici]KAI9618564.1 hypothetical protein H4Q26_012385 [Puccinia striiformis f. sp. tritici PST-130]KNE93814.1 hypothetical protein PSTG_12818 [Puccinia striiformis f. sp. tritici PST-78]
MTPGNTRVIPMVYRFSLCLLFWAATSVTAPPVYLGQLHSDFGNFSQSMLNRYTESVKSVTDKLMKKVPSSSYDGSVKPEPMSVLCPSCADAWYHQGFFAEWQPCTHPIPSKGGTIDCRICLEDLYDGQGIKQRATCRHCFHTACLSRWERESPTCPLCRLGSEVPSSSLSAPPLEPGTASVGSQSLASQLSAFREKVFDFVLICHRARLDPHTERVSAGIDRLCNFAQDRSLALNRHELRRRLRDLVEYTDRCVPYVDQDTSELVDLVSYTMHSLES